MLTYDILMDLITVATQLVLVMSVILVAAWFLMERAKERRAEQEEQGNGAVRVVSGVGAHMMSAYQRDVRGNL